MAYETGTATDANDFFTKLKAFLTTNSDLVAADQAWEEQWTLSSSEFVLKGQGLAGTDNVLVGFRIFVDPVNKIFNLFINGMTGLLTGATNIGNHVNSGPLVGMYLDDLPFTYWLVANGRRFAVVVQISTVFEALYGGFFLPYATPDQYPAPLFVGGSRGSGVSGLESWRSVDDSHSHFTAPATFSNQVTNSSAQMLDPGGIWTTVVNRGAAAVPCAGIGPDNIGEGFGSHLNDSGSQPGYSTFQNGAREAFGGEYALTPMTLVQGTPADQTFGILDGVFRVSGYENAAANTVTLSSTDHMVVPNAFRSGAGDFWALALA